jgi:phosphoglycolate phosphatase-like HAD superfamily hydrolase
VLSGAKRCPEKPGAQKALEALSKRYRLYLNSTTPEDGLREIVHVRGWASYFVGVFGYPHEKTGTVKRIIEREKVESAEVVVIGDGESDRKAAMHNGCPFVYVNAGFRFEGLHRMIAAL